MPRPLKTEWYCPAMVSSTRRRVLTSSLRTRLRISRVRVAVLTPEEIRWYVDSGEPDDKAGAYAVQGLASRFIEAVEGSYSNVVGLPVARVYRLLGELGFIDGTTRSPSE